MKVAVVCSYDLGATGGVQAQCVELSERLRVGGDDVVLAGPGRGAGWTTLGRTVAIEANGSRVPFTVDPVVFRRVTAATDGCDVVHVHEPLMPLAGWAALSTDKPIVATFHADPSPMVRGLYRAFSPVLRRMLERVVVTAVSPIAASVLPTGMARVELIPNAIDVGSYTSDLERRHDRVAFLGRDDPRKGLDVILDVWPTVLERHPEAELVVIGAQRPHAPRSVVFAGRTTEEEKRSLLGSAGVLLAPNLGGESFGVVVVEGLAAGCAVVASDIPAFRHVAPGAIFVRPGDRTAWADAITGLLDRPAEIDERARAGVRSVQRFDWDEVVDAYRAAYRRALEH